LRICVIKYETERLQEKSLQGVRWQSRVKNVIKNENDTNPKQEQSGNADMHA